MNLVYVGTPLSVTGELNDSNPNTKVGVSFDIQRRELPSLRLWIAKALVREERCKAAKADVASVLADAVEEATKTPEEYPDLVRSDV